MALQFKVRVLWSLITIAIMYWSMPYLEQWLNTSIPWGLGAAIATGLVLFPNLRVYRSTNLLELLAFFIVFALHVTTIDTVVTTFGFSAPIAQLFAAGYGVCMILWTNYLIEKALQVFSRRF